MPANPNDRKTPTVPQAVRQLRIKLGDTQQQFAQRLGLAISTVVRYESTRPPRAEVLSRLYKMALENELRDVAAMFNQAILGEVAQGLATGQYPLTDDERTACIALVSILRNSRHLPELRKPAQITLKNMINGVRRIEKRRKAGTMIFAPHEEVASDEILTALTTLEKDFPGYQGRPS